MSNSENYWSHYQISDLDSEDFVNEYNKSINHFKTIDRLYPYYNKLFDLFLEHKTKL